MKNQLHSTFERIPGKSRTRIFHGYRKLVHTDLYQQVVGFTCMHCKQSISSDPKLSGVNNRNHCPYCLTSKHVDLFKAGDRLNACKASMRLMGLAWKKSKNKYGSGLGELMIIHRCDACGELSLNRIAADDLPDLIQGLFRDTINLPTSLKHELIQKGIQPLLRKHQSQMQACLFGNTHW
jgi:hypothetical protein